MWRSEGGGRGSCCCGCGVVRASVVRSEWRSEREEEGSIEYSLPRLCGSVAVCGRLGLSAYLSVKRSRGIKGVLVCVYGSVWFMRLDLAANLSSPMRWTPEAARGCVGALFFSLPVAAHLSPARDISIINIMPWKRKRGRGNNNNNTTNDGGDDGYEVKRRRDDRDDRDQQPGRRGKWEATARENERFTSYYKVRYSDTTYNDEV